MHLLAEYSLLIDLHGFFLNSNVNFHENLSSGSQDVLCGRMDTRTHTHTHTDMKKLTVTFHNFSNMPNQITLMFEFPNTIPKELNIFYFLQ